MYFGKCVQNHSNSCASVVSHDMYLISMFVSCLCIEYVLSLLIAS